MVLARVPRARALALAALAPEGASSSRTDAASTPARPSRLQLKLALLALAARDCIAVNGPLRSANAEREPRATF
jgi:hypothetical protein